MLFIDARGRYLAERQLCAVVAVVLNFHAKAELETMQSGAGQPRISSVWRRPSSGRSCSSLDGGGWLLWF